MRVLVDPNLPDHRKLRKLTHRLNITDTLALGHLVTLWCAVMRMSETGDLAGWTEEDVALAAKFNEKPRNFVDALVHAGFLERRGELLIIHDWVHEQGNFIEKRRQWRDRQRLHRESRKSHVGHTGDSLPPVPLPLPVPVPVPVPLPAPLEGGDGGSGGARGGGETGPGEEILRLLMQKATGAKLLPNGETIRRNIEAALAAGVKAGDVDAAFMDPKSRGRKVWEILDDMKPNGSKLKERGTIEALRDWAKNGLKKGGK